MTDSTRSLRNSGKHSVEVVHAIDLSSPENYFPAFVAHLEGQNLEHVRTELKKALLPLFLHCVRELLKSPESPENNDALFKFMKDAFQRMKNSRELPSFRGAKTRSDISDIVLSEDCVAKSKVTTLFSRASLMAMRDIHDHIPCSFTGDILAVQQPLPPQPVAQPQQEKQPVITIPSSTPTVVTISSSPIGSTSLAPVRASSPQEILIKPPTAAERNGQVCWFVPGFAYDASDEVDESLLVDDVALKFLSDLSLRLVTLADLSPDAFGKLQQHQLGASGNIDDEEDTRPLNGLRGYWWPYFSSRANSNKEVSCLLATIVNSYGTLTSSTSSPGMSLVCCGFSDSVIRIWNNNKQQKLRRKQVNMKPMHEYVSRNNDVSSYPVSGINSKRRRFFEDSSSSSSSFDLAVNVDNFSGGNYFMDNEVDDGYNNNKMMMMDEQQHQSEDAGNDCDYEFLLVGHSKSISSLDFSPTVQTNTIPSFLLSSSLDKSVLLWDVEFQRPVSRYALNDLCWNTRWFQHTGSNFFSACCGDRLAYVFSTSSRFALRMFCDHGSDVSCSSFHPNGMYLATGCFDAVVRIWDIPHGGTSPVFRLEESVDAITSLCWSPSGRLLAAGNARGKILVWRMDVENQGELCVVLSGHLSQVTDLRFSGPDEADFGDTSLVSSSTDFTVRLWDLGAVLGGYDVDKSLKIGSVSRNCLELAPSNTFITKSTPIFSLNVLKENEIGAIGQFCL